MKNKKGDGFGLMGLIIILLLLAVLTPLFLPGGFFRKASTQFVDMIPSIGCPGNSTEVYILTPETFKACENQFKKDETLSAIHSSISEHIPTILWDSYEVLDDQNVCAAEPKTPLQNKLCSQITCLKNLVPLASTTHINEFKKFLLKTSKNPSMTSTFFDEKQDTYYETKCLKTS